MIFDVESHLGAVERSVSSLERDGLPARGVALSRVYATTIEDLWDARDERGADSAMVHACQRRAEPRRPLPAGGQRWGRYADCERLSRFALTWEFSGDVLGGGTLLRRRSQLAFTLTHTERLSAHWDEYGPGAVGVGWELGLLGLALHLAQPDEPKPDDAAFAVSLSGKAFMAGSSDGWMQAAVAAGMDPDAATAAARRTAAF